MIDDRWNFRCDCREDDDGRNHSGRAFFFQGLAAAFDYIRLKWLFSHARRKRGALAHLVGIHTLLRAGT